MIGDRLVAAIGPLGHDPGDVRSRTRELLSRPPFDEGGPGPVRRLLRYLGDLLAGFLGEVFDGALGTALLPWLLVALGVAVVAWLVWRVTRGLAVDRSVAVVPTESMSRSAADWHAAADAAEARGERRDALRYRYSAMVAALLSARVLEDVPGRTVHELEQEIARTVPAIADEVAAAGTSFDAAVYGHLEVTDEDLEVVAAAARHAAGQRPLSGGRR